MNLSKFNISKPIKYINKQGEEKTYWANVGTLIEFQKQDGTTSRIVEIPAIGLKASAFPVKPKVATPPAEIAQIPTEEIPF